MGIDSENGSKSKLKKQLDPRRYPIVVRVVDGYLEASQPDLSIYRVRGKFDEIRRAEEIGKIVLEVMNEATRKYCTLFSQDEDIPSPSFPKGTLVVPSAPLLSVREVAEYLGTSQDTVRRLCRDGKLKPTLTRGGHRRFRMEEIQQFRNTSRGSDPEWVA